MEQQALTCDNPLLDKDDLPPFSEKYLETGILESLNAIKGLDGAWRNHHAPHTTSPSPHQRHRPAQVVGLAIAILRPQRVEIGAFAQHFPGR